MNLHVIGFVFQLGCRSVTVHTNGLYEPAHDVTTEAFLVVVAKGTKVANRSVQRLVHLENGEGIDIIFEDGASAPISVLQHTPPTEAVALLFALDPGGGIVSDPRGVTLLKRNDPFGNTNVEGVLTAGDTNAVLEQATLPADAGLAFQLGHDANEKFPRNMGEIVMDRI